MARHHGPAAPPGGRRPRPSLRHVLGLRASPAHSGGGTPGLSGGGPISSSTPGGLGAPAGWIDRAPDWFEAGLAGDAGR